MSRVLKSMSIIICLATSALHASDKCLPQLSGLEMVDAAAPGNQAGLPSFDLHPDFAASGIMPVQIPSGAVGAVLSSSTKTQHPNPSTANQASGVKRTKVYGPRSVGQSSAERSGTKMKHKKEEGSAAMPDLFYVDQEGRIYVLTSAKERLIVVSQSSRLTPSNASARDVKAKEKLDEPFNEINEETVKEIIDANDPVYTEGLKILLINYYRQNREPRPDIAVEMLLERLVSQRP